MEKDGALKMPIVAVNDAKTKNLFDNRYGTGQSTLDGIIRATDMLLAGKCVVVAGYGWCGKGVAQRARGMGAVVIVTEVDPVRALEAAMDGFVVTTMDQAVKLGELFVTVTGDINVLVGRHFKSMKSGAVVCNSGHFDVEININDLEALGGKPVGVRANVHEYTVDGKKIYLLAEGRLVNLAAAEGHPASVMDMSFSTQALAAAWMATQGKIEPKVYEVPTEIEENVARLKIASMGISMDSLTDEQRQYLASWTHGT
jgi:adenosylhomocysteinase